MRGPLALRSPLLLPYCLSHYLLPLIFWPLLLVFLLRAFGSLYSLSAQVALSLTSFVSTSNVILAFHIDRVKNKHSRTSSDRQHFTAFLVSSLSRFHYSVSSRLLLFFVLLVSTRWHSWDLPPAECRQLWLLWRCPPLPPPPPPLVGTAVPQAPPPVSLSSFYCSRVL